MLLLFCLVMSLHAVPAPLTPRAFVPLEKKGPLAWENAQILPARGRARGGVNRLHVHAVDDQTNRVYAKQVCYFLQHVKSEQLSFGTVHERDVALADYLSDGCYIFSSASRRATRCSPASCRSSPSTGATCPRPLGHSGRGTVISAIAIEMTLTGALLPALALLLSEDCYLREQGWRQFIRSFS